MLKWVPIGGGFVLCIDFKAAGGRQGRAFLVVPLWRKLREFVPSCFYLFGCTVGILDGVRYRIFVTFLYISPRDALDGYSYSFDVGGGSIGHFKLAIRMVLPFRHVE